MRKPRRSSSQVRPVAGLRRVVKAGGLSAWVDVISPGAYLAVVLNNVPEVQICA